MKKYPFFQVMAVAVAICILGGVLAFCSKDEPANTENNDLPNTQPVLTQPTQPPVTDTRTMARRMIAEAAEYYGVSEDVWPESLVELLERNRETQAFVLGYPVEHDKEHEIDMREYENCEGVPLFMQWDPRWGYNQYGTNIAGLNGCGPVSLSMVAYYFTKDPNMSPDKILEFAYENRYCTPENGTAWTLISKGSAKLGLKAKTVPLVEGTMRKELNAGHPIIVCMGPGDFTTTGHFIVLVAYEDGMFRVNDCNSYANSEKLWPFEQIAGQIRGMWAISYSG